MMKILTNIREKIIYRRHEKTDLDYSTLFKTLCENTDDFIWLYDLDGNKFINFSRTVEKLLGFTVDELKDKPLQWIMTRESCTFIFNKINTMLSGYENKNNSVIKSMNNNIVYRSKKESQFQIDTSIILLANTKNKFNKILGISGNFSKNEDDEHNINQIKDSIKILSKSLEEESNDLRWKAEHHLLVNVLETMTDAFISLDNNWCFTYMNRNAGEIFGKNPTKMIGKNIWSEFPEGIGQQFRLSYKKALKEQKYMHIEEYYPQYDKWFENRIFPSEEGLAIFFQDITYRKKAQGSLEESEAQYRFIFNNNPLPMLIYERGSLKILAINEAFTIHYGYTQEDLDSLLLTDLYIESEKEAIISVAAALQGHANVGEWHHMKKDGTVITIIAQSHDLKYKNRQARVAVIMDITERKIVEMEILQLNKELELRVIKRTAQLETAYKEMESFSYSISHDLRAPLRSITGFSEIIMRRYYNAVGPEVQHYLNNILKASKRMENLIEDLLVYSRLGRQGVQLKPISLSAVLDEVSNDFLITLKEINGTLELAGDLPLVLGDRSLLHLILTNLIDNSIKYRKQDVPVRIKIWSETQDNKIIIYISDNSIGIPEEHHKRIFNIFQRLHSDDKIPGTGIGLSSVKKSVALLNGNISVQSEVGKGSTFYIELTKGE